MKKLNFVKPILLLASILIFNFGCSDGNNIAKQPADFNVQAAELFQVFSADEATGNKKYVGKILEVIGTIKGVKTTSNGTINLILEANDVGAVVCNFPKKKHLDLENLEAGGTVKIKGTCSGYIFDVMLDNCVLINS